MSVPDERERPTALRGSTRRSMRAVRRRADRGTCKLLRGRSSPSASGWCCRRAWRDHPNPGSLGAPGRAQWNTRTPGRSVGSNPPTSSSPSRTVYVFLSRCTSVSRRSVAPTQAQRSEVRKASTSSSVPPIPAKLIGHTTASFEVLNESVRCHVPYPRARGLRRRERCSGVNRDELTVPGIASSNEVGDRDRLTNLIRDWVTPDARFSVDWMDARGVRVLVVSVSEGANKPYGLQSNRSGGIEFFIRRGGNTYPARHDEVVAAAREGSQHAAAAPYSIFRR